MEYNLEKKVILNIESEYKSLYQWSLNEVEDKHSRPLIPWNWTLREFNIWLNTAPHQLNVKRGATPIDFYKLFEEEEKPESNTGILNLFGNNQERDKLDKKENTISHLSTGLKLPLWIIAFLLLLIWLK
jgi:hypothetical protein